MLSSIATAVVATAQYYLLLAYILLTRCSIEAIPARLARDTAVLVHVYSLAKTLQLWHAPHYRAPSLAHDMRANLRNVAIPGTGVPLSAFCASRAAFLAFLLVVNPLASAAGALYLSAARARGIDASAGPPDDDADADGADADGGNGGNGRATAAAQAAPSPVTTGSLYRELLLAPRHWLASWRLNCLLVAWHHRVAASAPPSAHSFGGNGSGAEGYALEDKAAFLLEADRAGLPVAPFVRAPRVFVKHRAVEGGQGIHVFRNFTAGGDWIISEALDNAPCIARLLPPDAPLSTFRVVTASVAWLEERQAMRPGGGGGGTTGGGAGGGGTPVAQVVSPPPRDAALSPTMALQQQAQAQSKPWGAQSLLAGAGALWGRAPSPGPRTLHGGRRSRAGDLPPPPPPSQQQQQPSQRQPSRSPRLPVSTGVPHAAAATPVPQANGSDDGDEGGDSGRAGGRGGGRGGRNGGSDTDSSGGDGGWHSPAGGGGSDGSYEGAELYERSIEVLTAVFRAGLSGADTDHACVCYPVDDAGGLGRGVTSTHWYRVGLRHALRVPAAALSAHDAHPQTGCLVAGSAVPDFWGSVAALALQAHALLAPAVPLVGWDVALPAEPEGPVLLEMNVSCNLFNGAVDRAGYADFAYAHFAALHDAERGG